MAHYLLVDSSNIFFRVKHVVNPKLDDWTKVGFVLSTIFDSVAKCWRQFNADHVVFCFDGRSWRKDVYPAYKRNRAEARAAASDQQKDEDALFFSAFNDLSTFLTEHTNCTVLHEKTLEADDFIAHWISNHPDDTHTIISTDSDFYQLISDKVQQYNGVSKELITSNGIFDDRNKPVIDKHTKKPKVLENPEWLLFLKCMRGDSTDKIFSAYPGVRIKGTKNKVGLTEAFEDRHKKGYAYNNLMLQRWSDHNGVEHKVMDDYERNRMLIGLYEQPSAIQNLLTDYIKTIDAKNISMPGARFLKFCGKYDLTKLADNANNYSKFLTARYNKP